MNIILASTSPYRKQLLARLGITFSCVAPTCNETELKQVLLQDRNKASDIARSLAFAKAQSIAQAQPQSLVIGSDQVAHFDGDILDKPGSTENALEQLLCMNGQSHELLTAVCILYQGQRIDHLDTTTLKMAQHSPQALNAYVQHDQPTDCAGSYKLEALGISLFEYIASEDQSAIIGLPLLFVARTLRSFGLSIPSSGSE